MVVDRGKVRPVSFWKDRLRYDDQEKKRRMLDSSTLLMVHKVTCNNKSHHPSRCLGPNTDALIKKKGGTAGFSWVCGSDWVIVVGLLAFLQK